MQTVFRKTLRTAQNFFPFLHQAKNDAYYLSRRYLGTVHDADFAVVQMLPRGERDVFLDIGANRGQSILAIRRYRPDAEIISFEPNPGIFRELSRRFGDWPGVRLENIGLGAAESDATLYVPAYRGFTYDGIASFSHEAAQTYLGPDTLYWFDPRHVTVSEQVCHIRTLDSFGLAPSFIKLDIEGFEYEAIQGAHETLRQHEPFLLVERFWGDARVSSTLEQLGYIEVVRSGSRLVAGRSSGVNMVLATPRRLSSLA